MRLKTKRFRNVLNKDLILQRVNKVESGCWLWTGTLRPDGYGCVSVDTKKYLAHRLAFHLWRGFALDSLLLVLHKCNNKGCVNPAHLYDGTHKDNAIDAVKAGVWVDNSAERSGITKFTWNDVRTMRKLRSEGKTLCALSVQYKCHLNTIWQITNNKRWKEHHGTNE